LAKKNPSDSIDILSHFLVPKAEILSADEKKRVLKKFRIDETQFPKIFVTDPLATAIKANVGDIIVIYREDLPAKYLSYRYVI